MHPAPMRRVRLRRSAVPAASYPPQTTFGHAIGDRRMDIEIEYCVM